MDQRVATGTSTSVEPREAGRKGVVGRAVETVASGLGNGAGFLATSGIAFVIFGVLWAAFAIGLIWSQGSVDAAWGWLRGLPLVMQGVMWLLLLPVTAGLWIWETSWPLILRLVLVAGLAGWSLLIFLPKAAASGS
jgi:hypothetical protein